MRLAIQRTELISLSIARSRTRSSSTAAQSPCGCSVLPIPPLPSFSRVPAPTDFMAVCLPDAFCRRQGARKPPKTAALSLELSKNPEGAAFAHRDSPCLSSQPQRTVQIRDEDAGVKHDPVDVVADHQHQKPADYKGARLRPDLPALGKRPAPDDDQQETNAIGREQQRQSNQESFVSQGVHQAFHDFLSRVRKCPPRSQPDAEFEQRNARGKECAERRRSAGDRTKPSRTLRRGEPHAATATRVVRSREPYCLLHEARPVSRSSGARTQHSFRASRRTQSLYRQES